MIGAAATTTKIAVVGAGSVGATIAYACLIRGIGRTIALYDVDAAKTRAEVLDLNHGLQFVPQATVVGSDDIEVCRDADLVAITAGAKQKPGQTRLELAEANVALCKALVPRLLEVAPDAILLLVTNPVDVITYAALRYSDLPPRRVFGSGTVLDSSRLRLLIADHCGVAVQSVHAYIAGEHGDSEIPLWSSAAIGSVPLLAWEVPGRPPLDAAAREDIHRRVVGAAGEIIRGKGATNYAVGLASARIIEAVLYDQRMVLPVSSLLDGQAGIHDVCLSLPSVVDRLGVELVLPSPLSEGEVTGLRRSADMVKDVIRSLGL
ncbi:MAG TPA: L-lactate dehydrogenase [Actinomycetes bacterium]|jgi:L-lactate dehydrogenase|nr:L-lactate dehydrogenase [Actinomycetes bacterium]